MRFFRKDRDVENVYLLMVEFSSYEDWYGELEPPGDGRVRPRSSQTLCDGPLQFRSPWTSCARRTCKPAETQSVDVPHPPVQPQAGSPGDLDVRDM